jgi:hypothetical protein
MRTIRLLPSFLLVAAGALPVLVACGGREVSLGTNHSQLSLVDPSTVSGTVPSCGTGDAHPNVCCQASAGQAAQCGVYIGAPFQPCDSGWTAYPDPRSCCTLDDPSNCGAPPPSPPPLPPGVCGYACEPGWYPIQNGCCQDTGNGQGVCYGWASAGDGGIFDDGGPTTCVDAGFDDSGNGTPGCDPTPQPPTADAGDQPGQPPCTYACPAGWQRAVGAADVCCRDLGGGEIECFSQATGPQGGGSSGGDGGVDPTPADGGVFDAGADDASTMVCGSSNNGQCMCSSSVGGHSYELDCSDTAQVCTCILDGIGTSTSGVTECSNPDGGPSELEAFWTNVCHFPL